MKSHKTKRQAQAEEVLAALAPPCRLVWGRLDGSIGGTTLVCEVHSRQRAGWVGNQSDLYGGEGYYVCEETKQALSGPVNKL